MVERKAIVQMERFLRMPPKRRLTYLMRLSGRPLEEWSEELNMRTEKVLEFLCELMRQEKIKDVEFV